MTKMTMEEIIEAFNEIEEGEAKTIELDDGATLKVACSTTFIGGEHLSGQIMCSYMGNISYGNRKRLAEDLMAEMIDDGTCIVSIDY